MADINKLSQLVNGRNRNVDLPANTPVVLSVKIGGLTNTELTKAILDNLVSLQNGSDIAASLHHHDGRYFTETELGAASGTTGSDLIGDDDDYVNFTPTTATVKGALAGIDAALATAGGTEFSDATFRIEDDGNDTKKIAFQASGISAATTRTITMPDADVNLGDISAQAQDIADLVTLSGVAANATDLGTFTGITIPDNSDIKEALQALETNVEGKANTALSNLSSTAVNTDILPDSTGTRDLGSPSFAFQEVWSSQFIAPASATGFVGTALRTGSNNSNLLVLSTGTTVDGTSGELVTRSGDVSGSTGNSGNAGLRSGNLTAASASGSTGIVVVRSGNVSGVSSTGSSGDVVIRSGDTVDGNSGSIFINATQPTGTGTRGSVTIGGLGLSLNGGASGISVNGNVIGNLANPVLAQDAATKNYVDSAISGVSEFSDSVFRIQDNGDATKELAFEVSAISTATTRTITVPDANVDLGLIATAIQSSEKGSASGVATLDSGGKVPASQLPNSVMEYLGTWAASTNTPALANGIGNAGDVYIASDAGTVDFGAGNISFAQGDWVIYSGSVWQKSVNSNAVASVNGYTGVVVLDTDDISEGSNLYFTETRVRDTDLAGFTSGAGSVTSSDSVLSAIQKLDGNIGALNTNLSGKADTDLSNLASTAVNADILPDATETWNLGSSSLKWDEVHASRADLASAVIADANGGQLEVSAGNTEKFTVEFVESTKVTNITHTSSGNLNILATGTGANLSLQSNDENVSISAGGDVVINAVGGINFSNKVLSNVADPVLGSDVANKNYVDQASYPTFVAGEAFAADTTFAVRFARTGETAGRVYKADNDASSNDNFYVIGVVTPGASILATEDIQVKLLGTQAQGALDTAWNAADIGKPVFLGTDGALTITAPTNTNDAIVRVGMVQTTTSIFVQPQVVGVN